MKKCFFYYYLSEEEERFIDVFGFVLSFFDLVLEVGSSDRSSRAGSLFGEIMIGYLFTSSQINKIL